MAAMARQKGKVSIKDVAAEAGISYAAVSAVLNGKVGKNIRVGEDAQRRVWAAVAKLNYTPNFSARSLVSGRTGILSVFTYEPIFPFSSESEFYPFLLGIEQEAEHRGLDLLMITNRLRQLNGDTADSGVSRMQMADGGILIGVNRDEESVERFLDAGFPLVIIGRRQFERISPCYVTFDYKAIIGELIEYAYSCGHRHFVYLRETEDLEILVDREHFLYEACTSREGMTLEVASNNARNINPAQIQGHIYHGCTLFLTDNFDILESLEKITKELNLAIGNDISLILLNDTWKETSTNWTCWSSVRHILGMEAVNMLCKLIDGETPDFPKLIKPELIRGSSVANIGLAPQ